MEDWNNNAFPHVVQSDARGQLGPVSTLAQDRKQANGLTGATGQILAKYRFNNAVVLYFKKKSILY